MDERKRPTIGVGVVILQDDRILIVKRGKPPRQGQWSIPGGRQEWGETIKAAALREVQEETTLQVELLGLIDVVDAFFPDGAPSPSDHLTLIDYAAKVVDGTAEAADDIDDLRWATWEECNELIEWDETKRIIAKAREFFD